MAEHKLGFSPQYKTHYTTDINAENEGQDALIAGWVTAHRPKKSIIFVKIRDSKGIAQIVLKPDTVSEETWEVAKSLTMESSISVKGTIIADERSLTGAELKPEEIIVHRIADPLPIDLTGKKTETLIDTIFEHRELSIRRPESIAVFSIKSQIAKAVREFYSNNQFTEIFTPYILSSATEGGAEMFPVDYFGEKGVLAQSCQFYKQAAIHSHEKVFGIIPSWRAEKSRTPKHVVEFHQIETEIAFGNHETIMQVQEQLVHHVVKHVKEHCQAELAVLGREDLKIPELPLKRYTFEEAKKRGTELVIAEGMEEPEGDLSTPAETLLSKEHADPFFITSFPTELRGMYYEAQPDNDDITNSLDLVAPEGFGEMSSGGVRVNDADRLVARIEKKGMDPENFSWYINQFRYGGVPHAGFGLGFERLTRWITGVSHIREAIMFPRTPDLWEP
ncbi:MAG: aspartate--tRNA(Asn) ligase [Candidatus Kariarchaeaceae archaeon]|jgi:asparaginyl-tRNA synthetase